MIVPALSRDGMRRGRDGKALRTIPVSSGSPQHTTYNGQMVISEKFMRTRTAVR